MKTFAIAALAAVATPGNAFEAEFMRGAKSGFFVTSEEQFADYGCALPEIDPWYANVIEMTKPFKKMVENTINHGEPTATTEAAYDALVVGAKLAGLFTPEYEGTEFCKGLMSTWESKSVMYNAASMIITPTKPELINKEGIIAGPEQN